MATEGDAVAKALFSCTRVELLFNETPAGEKQESEAATRTPPPEIVPPLSPLTPTSELRSPMRKRSESEVLVEMVMEEHRGPIFNGEQVALLLSLTPVKSKLESIFATTFGIPITASSDRHIQLWNRLTEVLIIQLHLLSDPPASTLPDDPARADDLVTLPGCHPTPSSCKASFPVQSVAPIQKAKLVSRRGKEYFRPGVYKLEFVVKDLNATSTDKTRCYIWVSVELPNQIHLQKIIAEVTELGMSCPSESMFNKNKDSGRLSSLRSSGEGQSKGLLMQLYDSIPIPPKSSAASESCGSTPYMMIMKPAWLIDPLRVELHVVEPHLGCNCVQVSVSNPLSHDIIIHELSIHLPTTVNSKAESTVVGTTGTNNSYCMLSTSPATMGAHVTGLSGFEALFKIECFMIAVEGEVLPITMSGGETYGFMFIIRPYDLRPTIAQQPAAAPSAKVPPRGGGGRIVGNYFGSTPRISVDSNESFSAPSTSASHRQTLTEPMALKSNLTISFKVEGLSSSFDKSTSVRWMLHPQPGTADKPPEEERHLKISKHIPPRARRRESLRSGVIVTTPTSVTSGSRFF